MIPRPSRFTRLLRLCRPLCLGVLVAALAVVWSGWVLFHWPAADRAPFDAGWYGGTTLFLLAIIYLAERLYLLMRGNSADDKREQAFAELRQAKEAAEAANRAK